VTRHNGGEIGRSQHAVSRREDAAVDGLVERPDLSVEQQDLRVRVCDPSTSARTKQKRKIRGPWLK
jgi:hypothetical protein